MCHQQPRHQAVRRFKSAPHSLLEEEMAIEPASTPGKETSWEASIPACTSKIGRARIGNPGVSAVKFVDRSPKNRKLPSRPTVWQSSNQKPMLRRAPERTSLSTEPPNSDWVPGAPKTPAN